MFESTGKLLYDPHARIKQAPFWCILKTDEGIVDYYKHWIKKELALDLDGKRHPIKFETTVWGSHVSVNRGVQPPNIKLWKKHQGENIKFTYSNRVYHINNWFFCVDAYSERLEEIRTELGLSKTPPYGFHVTIGRVNKQYLTSLLPANAKLDIKSI
jgi:hypothetical protein